MTTLYNVNTNTMTESQEIVSRRYNIRLEESNFPQLYTRFELNQFPNSASKVRKFFTATHDLDHILVLGSQTSRDPFLLAVFKRFLKNYPSKKGYYITYSELISLITRTWNDSESLNLFDALKKVDVLCVTGFSIPYNRDNNNTLRLKELLHHRQNLRKLCLFSSSLLKKELVEYYELVDSVFYSLVFND